MSTAMCNFCTKTFPVDQISLATGVCELCEELLPKEKSKNIDERDYE